MTVPQTPRTHRLAIAAIVAAGLLLGTAILLGGRAPSPAEAGHADEPAHAPAAPAAKEEKRQPAPIALTDAQAQAAGIVLETAGPGRIRATLELPGEIRLNEDRTAHVVPRVAAVVESVRASLGQPVKQGQVLAVLASATVSEQRSELQTALKRLALARTSHEREKSLWEQRISAEQDYLQARQALSEAEVAVANAQQKLAALGLVGGAGGGLNRFELRAPFDGTVIEKHLSQGEAVKEDTAAFTVSDLSRVWAEIAVPAGALQRVRVGEPVTIRAAGLEGAASGTITYVGALIGEQTRTAKARVVLANPQGAWRPGLFVSVEAVGEEAAVPVAVPRDAVQTVDGNPVVFVRVAEGFVPQPVRLGRGDAQRVEVLEGLQAGAVFAAAGSFTLKSELGKAGAEHAH